MTTPVRPLHEIAREITSLWPDPFFGAIPYIGAMRRLASVTDSFGYDSGHDIVMYFLSNAKTWKGNDAARIKNELRVMIGQKPVVSRATAPKAVSNATAERKMQAAVVKAAVMRAIFCPFTGQVLDMRRAVVIDTGTRMFVCTATHWDEVRPSFEEHLGAEAMAKVKVYDGRELYTPSGRVR